MLDIITRLNKFYGIKKLDEKTLKLLLSYEKDGQYILASIDELNQMPSDARFDALWGSTYHACKLLLNYYLDGHKKIYDTYKRCLNKCLDAKFMFEGFMNECETIDFIKELIEQGLLETTNSKEAKRLDSIIDSYRSIADDYPSIKNLKELLYVYDKNFIFTYGTLMKGNFNHHYLKDDEYIGDSILDDYGLLELGFFPGAIKKEGYKVIGEIYKVTDKEKRNIDYLEGDLYSYQKVYMRSNKKLYYVGFYEYKFSKKDEIYKLRMPYGKWNDIHKIQIKLEC